MTPKKNRSNGTMATVRELLLSIISCSKCGNIVDNDRTYVNDKMLCGSCAENCDNTLKRLVKSQIWSTLCQSTKLLLQGNNGMSEEAQNTGSNDGTHSFGAPVALKEAGELINSDVVDVSNDNEYEIDEIVTSVKPLDIEISDTTKVMKDENRKKQIKVDDEKLTYERTSGEDIDESFSCNDSLIGKALKYFFNNQPGSLIIQKHTEGDLCQENECVSNNSEIKSYESVMQKEMEYFFNSEKGKILIKSVIAEELKGLCLETSSIEKKHNDSNLNGINMLADDTEFDSDNDMFVPPTPPVNNSKAFISSVMATSISLESRKIINKFAQYFNLKMYNNLFDDTDCLISDELVFTQKWLYARCKGFPIVKSTWMKDCLSSGQMLPVTEYLFQPHFQVPLIFKTLDIILCPPFSELSDMEYLKLWSMAGARVSLANDWLPGPEHLKRIIVFDVSSLDLSPDEMKSMIMFHRAPAVTKSYLLTMLTFGSVDPIENHLYDIFLLNVTELKRMGFPCREDLVTE